MGLSFKRHAHEILAQRQPQFHLVPVLFRFFPAGRGRLEPDPVGLHASNFAEGDVVVGQLCEPQRGEVETFVSPKDGVRWINCLVQL